MSRLDNALKALGKAHLLGDDTLRLKAMNDLLHMAGIGSDVLNGSTPKPSTTRKRPKAGAPAVVWYRHESVQHVGRVGRHMRGRINGEGAQLYISGNYITAARDLYVRDRCEYRPAKGPGGRSAVWLTDTEAATVRAHIQTRWPSA
jgi:hypothetical protein